METFPAISPDFGLALKEDPRLRTAKLGDGYAQSAPDGLNFMEASYPYKASALTRAEKDLLVAFLRERQGAEPFLWTAPGESEPWKWTCKTWSATPDSAGAWTVSASFERSFKL